MNKVIVRIHNVFTFLLALIFLCLFFLLFLINSHQALAINSNLFSQNTYNIQDNKNNQNTLDNTDTPTITTLSERLFRNLKITSTINLPKAREDEFSENDIIFYNPDGGNCRSSSSSSAYTGSISISGSTYFEKLWSGFRSAGFTKEQTAGILANIKHEAGTGPTQHEGSHYPSTWTGQKFSNAEHVDGHFDLSKNPDISYGVGIIQFSKTWRVHFIQFLNSNATDILDLFNQPDKYSTAKISDYPSEEIYNKAIAVQIDYMMNESYAYDEKYKFFVEAKEKHQSMEDMASYWSSTIEQCADCGPGGSQYAIRTQDAKEIYNQYSNESFMTSADKKSSSSYNSQNSTSTSNGSEEEFETEEESGGNINTTNNDTSSNSSNSNPDNTDSTNNNSSNTSDTSNSNSSSTPQNATLLPNHKIITFYSADASENGGAKNAGKNASSKYNNGNLADGQAAKMQGNADSDLQLGDVIYIETSSDQKQEGSFVHKKYYIITDVGAHNFGNGKKTIDIFHDVSKPSDNNKAPFGQSSSAMVYKVASNVSWDEYMSKYHQKTDAPTTNDAEKATINVTWKDGWIVDGFEGYHREDAIDYPQKHGFTWGDSAHLKSFTTNMKDGSVGPNKILLHSTEGVHYDEKTSLDQYGVDNFYPAHFMVDMKHHWVYQAFPITGPSDAIKEHDPEAGIQIEVVGTCVSTSKLTDWYLYNEKNFKEEDWMYLAKLIFAISLETKIPLTSTVDWSGPHRLPFNEFKNYEGVLGHMHATDNNHFDPGNMWGKLSKLFDRLQGGSGDNCSTPWDGNVPVYSQCDTKWKDLPYGGSGTICNSGCGPSSFAMLATMLLGRVITPDETTKIAGDAGMHIAGSGSSWQITQVLGDHYGLEVEDLNNYSKSQQADLISQKLRAGWMIHLSGRGGSPFSSGGHFIGIYSMNAEGKWLLVDSAGTRGENNMKKAWDPSEVLTYAHNIKAVRKK